MNKIIIMAVASALVAASTVGLADTPKKAKEIFEQSFAVYFDRDSSTINEAMSNSIAQMSNSIAVDAGLAVDGGKRIRIEAFADETGTTEYNNALARRRANAVKNILVTNNVSNIDVVVYSEHHAHANAGGHSSATGVSDDGWAEHRRVTYHIISE